MLPRRTLAFVPKLQTNAPAPVNVRWLFSAVPLFSPPIVSAPPMVSVLPAPMMPKFSPAVTSVCVVSASAVTFACTSSVLALVSPAVLPKKSVFTPVFATP